MGLGLFSLAVAVAGLRWWTRADLYYNWDSVQYALGTVEFDVRQHQPHPPGSLFYVLAARALNLATGDPHISLLVLSALASALTVPALFALGRAAANERAGWWAAALGTTAPLFWFYGSLGLNYAADALLAALIGLASLGLWRGESTWRAAVAAGVWFGLAGGVRPTTLGLLSPLWVAALIRLARQRPGRAALAAAVASAITLTWLIPTALDSGGLREWLRLNGEMRHLAASSSVWFAPEPWTALRLAALTHRRSLESLLGVAWVLLPLAAWSIAQSARGKGQGVGRPDDPTQTPVHPHSLFWLLWIGPAALFYLLIHFNSPGYTMVYAPAVVALGSAALARGFSGLGATWLAGLVALVIAGNGALFWRGFPWASPMWGQRALSRPEIVQHDAYWRALRRYLAANFSPGGVRVLVTGTSTEGLRVGQALLPDPESVRQALHPMPALPHTIRRLSFLRFCSLEEVANDPRPVVGVWRTGEDRRYQRNTLGNLADPLPLAEIGGGFRVVRLR